MNRKVSAAVSWVLVVCAVVSTGLLVRQSAFSNKGDNQSVIRPDPVFVDDWKSLTAGGVRSGRTNAPVQIVEFADFRCSFCAKFENELRTVQAKHAESISLTLMHYPLSADSPSFAAALAAECADDQSVFDSMRAQLFSASADIGEVSWTEFGRRAGVPDVGTFAACVESEQHGDRVRASKEVGKSVGVLGTPEVLVNGWLLPRAPTANELEVIIENVSAGKPLLAGLEFGS